jgi:hypothetical protein
MHRLSLALLLAAAVPTLAAAQPAALHGVSAPPSYTAAPALGDSATAVFTLRNSAVAVVALPGGTERGDVIQRLRAVLAGAALGRDANAFQWRMLTSWPASPFDVYHERWTGYDGTDAVVAHFHHLRKDGRDVLVGDASLTGGADAEQMFRTGLAHMPTSSKASTWLVAELVGDPPFTEGFVGVGTGHGILPEPPPHPEEAAVRAAFEAYRAALLARDGEAALPHVAEAVFEYYGDMQRLALYATANEVRARPLPDQLYVLMLRTRIPTRRLREMTPRELFAHGVAQGWIGEESTRQQRVGRVLVNGNMAGAAVMQGGRPSPLRFAFVRRDGAWKWDMLGVIQWMDPIFRELADANGLTPEELLLRVVETANKRPLPPTVWDPPLRRP